MKGNIMATFSEIFKALRKDKHLTQEQVAEIFGVSPQAISRWGNATSYPEITQLPNIAAYFETTIDELLGVKKTVKDSIFSISLARERGSYQRLFG